MNDSLYTSDKGKDFIKSFESLSLTIYDDNGNIKGGFETIGWGHKIKPGDEILRQGITSLQAEQLFHLDLMEAEKIVKSKINISLNQNQFDSLVSFSFNTGKMSETLKSKIESAASEYEIKVFWSTHYIKSEGKILNGLIRRRLAECRNYFKIQTYANIT